MFDLNWWDNRRNNRRYDRPIVAPIHIKHVHSSVSYQWEIYQKYDQRGCASPSGCGALRPVPTKPIGRRPPGVSRLQWIQNIKQTIKPHTHWNDLQAADGNIRPIPIGVQILNMFNTGSRPTGMKSVVESAD